jgi:hypothetical protein
MVNIPYRHSDFPAAQRVSDQLSAMRRTAGAIVLALIVALLLGVLIDDLSLSGQLPNDLVPLDDPALAALFTA